MLNSMVPQVCAVLVIIGSGAVRFTRQARALLGGRLCAVEYSVVGAVGFALFGRYCGMLEIFYFAYL